MLITVFPAPTTAAIAKQIFNKYLSHERRNISTIGKDSIHSLSGVLVKMYCKPL